MLSSQTIVSQYLQYPLLDFNFFDELIPEIQADLQW